MATFTFWNRQLEETGKHSHHQIMTEVLRAEKRTFPSSEAFDFTLELRKRNVELIVMSNDTDSLMAYLVYAFKSKVALLHKVCVLPDYRRQGIARKMLLLHHQKLILRGCCKVQLWVDDTRTAAKDLYSSIGFKQVGRVGDYYGPHRAALHMVLDLQPDISS